MSQYPTQPPYPSPPPGPYGHYPSPYAGYPMQYGAYTQAPFDAYLAPFKRAAIMMFVVGGLICACGIFCTAAPWKSFLPEMLAQQGQSMPAGVTLDDVSTVYRVMGVAIVLLGVGHIVLGFFVRKGSSGATVTGLVFAILELLGLGLMLILGLVAGMGDPAGLASAACTVGGPAAVIGLLLTWLVQAMRAAPQLRAAHARYQYEYWQYAQAQQGYAQTAYQQAPPPPAAPPAAPPQAPPADPRVPDQE